MEAVAISWLIASASSPLIAVLALWTVYVFHTYRKRWRTVDLFLLTVAAQELVAAVFTFSYAIVSLINPPLSTVCSFIQWGLISIRTFQVATLTSMVVDRALTVRWPYRYRFSVRRNQIRYHIAVLALMSVLVGVAAVFAQVPNSVPGMMCSVHPSKWNFKFVVFVLGFYGVLLLISLICTAQIEIHKCRNGGKHQAKGMPYQLPDCSSSDLPVAASTLTSPLDNESHTGSTRALHRPYRHSSRRPYGKKTSGGTSDFRWPPVAVVSLVCFSVNHLPYLVLTSLATAMPWLWAPWQEAMLSWLRLVEGMLVPIIFCLVDQSVRAALKRTFQRRSGALSPLVGDDGPFQMYFDKDHFRKRGTFGSVTPIGIITNYRRTPGKKRRNRKCKYKLPGLQNGDSIIEKSCLSSNFLSTEPLSKLSCADLTSLEVWQEEEEENFYATLSDDISTFSYNSNDDNDMDDETRICEDVYGGSFTTIANDDFEFHDTRPCGGEVRMRPSLSVDVPPTSSFRSSIKGGLNTKDKLHKNDESNTASIAKDGSLLKVIFQSEEKKDPDLFTEEKTLECYPEPDVIKVPNTANQPLTPIAKNKTAWYSMNDLDLIDKTDVSSQERIYVLPIKSESTLSLYRLHLDEGSEHLLPITRSENNLNGDSGFGSGTQTMEPIWPSYHLLRKVSDPLYSQRMPELSVDIDSSKNYPCVLHPRMQKIPWISAWKKLGGTSSFGRCGQDKISDSGTRYNDSSGGVLLINDNFQLRQKEAFEWKDSVIYGREVLSGRNLTHDTNTYPENKSETNIHNLIPNEKNTGETPNDDRNNDNCKYVLSKRNSGKRRGSRKSSFKESLKNASSPYGKINDVKKGQEENFACNQEVNFPAREENIYEEITNKMSNNKSEQICKRISQIVDENSYAQTDILTLEIPYSNTENINNNNKDSNADSKRTGQEFSVNMKLSSVRENLQRNSQASFPLEQIVEAETPTSPMSSLQVNCPPDLMSTPLDSNINGNMVFYNRVILNDGGILGINDKKQTHLTYGANGNPLKYIDISDCIADHQMPLVCNSSTDTANVDGNSSNININYGQITAASNEKENMEGQNIEVSCMNRKERLFKREAQELRHFARRRENKKPRTNSKSIDSSDLAEISDFKRENNFQLVRRESDPRIKHRDIRRKGSNGKDNRLSSPIKKETTHHLQKQRSECRQEVSPKRRDISKFQRKETYSGLWPKEESRGLPNNHINSCELSQINNHVRPKKSVVRKDSGGYAKLGQVDLARQNRNLTNGDLSYSKDNQDLIRLQCEYVPHSDVNLNSNRDPDLTYTAARNQDSSEIYEWNRSSYVDQTDNNSHFQNRMDHNGVIRRNSKSKKDAALERNKRQRDVERRENESRVRRIPVSRERRATHEFDSREQNEVIEKRVRRTGSVNKDLARRNSYRGVDEIPQENGNMLVDDVNRNESVKLNNEYAIKTDENARMDNLVYGRRENGNFMHDSEILPFEIFSKPPSYNELMRHHITNKISSDPKDRCRQKKVAITDFL